MPRSALLHRLGVEVPILLAPMAGAGGPALAIAVARAGALPALPCAMLDADTLRRQVAEVRAAYDGPLNLNFFCHQPSAPDDGAQRAWRDRLTPYYRAFDLDLSAQAPATERRPFDAACCALVEQLRPGVVSFHFGLPDDALLTRVKATGAVVLSSATTVAEARWLAARGVDAVIAQGLEAGGHRGSFLDVDPASQIGTFALVPLIRDAIAVPVIAAGGIIDARGIEAAFALGAGAVQLGTAFLRTPQATISSLHRAALAAADAPTQLTNLFSGRPARGLRNRLMAELGPIAEVPPFPTAGHALAPLKQAAEHQGLTDFSPLWAGQAYPLARDDDATAITRQLATAIVGHPRR
ncbi:MAG: nitronate monooxygenase [Rhodocyclaceae bacterium]|nr:nitronate monooxygenase [Rhodocyclaceae bacterium]